MQTARFHQRKKALEKVFDKQKMVVTWRKIVRAQLRTQDIKDLYDYYDFNFEIVNRTQAIRASVLNGTYRASQPLVYRIEKKYGIARHLVLPQASDALVLQVLIESIADQIIKKQPSKKAFYARSKDTVPKPHDISEYGQTINQLWIKLQKTIYKFSKEKKLIVTTDLSNYYDSIDMQELQKVLSNNLDSQSEVITDLLFGIIETISWHPDYLPYSKRGLPTSNLEAIRLLAHSFLFEVDDVLKEKTDDCFTRWMDDIVVGTDSRKEAREIINAISDMLKSRGLALNLAKTDIYNQEEVMFNFQIKENDYVSSVNVISKTDVSYNELTTLLRRKFREHNKNNKAAKAWDKVAKRYITLFGKLQSEKLLTEIVDLYVAHPVLRLNILKYLLDIGYKKSTAKKVLKILDEIDIFDDISLYQICELVVNWEIPDTPDSKEFLKSFEEKLTVFALSRKNNSDFYSLLWFKAKYTRGEDLLKFLKKYENWWQFDAFLRRQATAVLSRLYLTDKEVVRKTLQSQVSSGEPNTVSLANQILSFIDIEKSDTFLNLYLFPKNSQKPYPLGKFLVLCSVLNSTKVRENPTTKEKILAQISDPYYRKWLDHSYNISEESKSS